MDGIPLLLEASRGLRCRRCLTASPPSPKPGRVDISGDVHRDGYDDGVVRDHLTDDLAGAIHPFHGSRGDGWWNPMGTFTVGTVVAQWAVALGAFIALNRWLVGKSRAQGGAGSSWLSSPAPRSASGRSRRSG